MLWKCGTKSSLIL